MTLSPRHQKIIELAKELGFLSTLELTDYLEVTPQTVRRDINYLCEKGLLKRYHGGASLTSSVQNMDYAARQTLNRDAKERMAKMAATQIPNNSSLFINIGTSTEAFAKALSDHENLRVITNNLNVATFLCQKPDFEVIVTCGTVRDDHGITGGATIDFIRQFKVDYGVIGISGIDADGTLLDFDYQEVQVAQAIIQNARQVLLMADYTKFSRTPMVRLGHVSEVDALVTDQEPPKPILDLLALSNVCLHIAQA